MSSTLNASAKPFIPGCIDFTLICTPIAEPDKKALSYPFSFIARDKEDDIWDQAYYMEELSGGLLGEEKCEVGNFPDNIAEYYWIHEGHNDEDAWECLCKLDNGNFGFYSASCDYTGFDCQGGMKLIVSKDLERLFWEGLTERSRALCIKEKKSPPSPVTKDYYSDLARALSKADEEDFSFPVPIAPEPKPATEATRAFVRVWENGKELILNLDHVNGMEMEALEYAIRGLTAQFLTPKGAARPKKKFYGINICCGTSVTGIDDYFKKRFGNPDKKWELKMKYSGGSFIRKWGKVEVSFILY